MRFVCAVFAVAQILLFASAVLSWFPVRQGFLADVKETLNRFTEPLLAPVRKLLPFLRTGGIDFTTMALFFALSVGRRQLCG